MSDRVILVDCKCGETYVLECGCPKCRHELRAIWWKIRKFEQKEQQTSDPKAKEQIEDEIKKLSNNFRHFSASSQAG